MKISAGAAVTYTQKLFLRGSLDKDVLEVGAGQGPFTGKISAVASTVRAVEVSKTAGRLISQVTGQYKQHIRDGEQASISISLGSILNPKLQLKTYDEIAIFNVFHYMKPEDAAHALIKCEPTLNEGGQIFIAMNAPGAHGPTFDQYLTEKRRGRAYPGYMCFQNEAVFGFDAKLKETKPEIFFHAGSSVDSPMVTRTRVVIDHKTHTQSKISTQSYFYGDRESMLMLLDAANLEPVEIYYETGGGDRIDDLDLTYDLYEKYTVTDMNICVIARRKPMVDDGAPSASLGLAQDQG